MTQANNLQEEKIQDLSQFNQQLRGKMRVYTRIKPKDPLEHALESTIRIPD